MWPAFCEKCVPWIPPSLGRKKKTCVFPAWKSGRQTSFTGTFIFGAACGVFWVSHVSPLPEVLRKSRNGVWPTCWHAPWLERPAVCCWTRNETPKVEGIFVDFFLEISCVLVAGNSDTVVFLVVWHLSMFFKGLVPIKWSKKWVIFWVRNHLRCWNKVFLASGQGSNWKSRTSIVRYLVLKLVFLGMLRDTVSTSPFSNSRSQDCFFWSKGTTWLLFKSKSSHH